MEDALKIAAAALAAVSAGIALFEKHGLLTGGLAGAAVFVFVLVILKLAGKKDTRQEEPPAVQERGQSVGDGVQSKGKVVFKGITQKSSGQQPGGQSVGKGVTAGKEGVTFEDVEQE